MRVLGGETVFFMQKRGVQGMGDKGITKARIMDADTMRRSVNRISFEIIERNANIKSLVLVGIRRRGVVLAERIAEKLFELEGIDAKIWDLDVTPWRDDVVEKTETLPEVPFELSGKTVIIVDDVLYTGRTVRAALDAIMSAGRPKCIQLAVLVDRGHRELPIRPDYVGKNLPTSKDEIVQVRVLEFDDEECVKIQQ